MSGRVRIYRPGQFMSEANLRDEIRSMLVETLMLPMPVAEIGDDRPLFGPEGLGLDSVDALQLVVALDKKYGVKITDQQVAQQVLRSVSTMAAAVTARETGGQAG
jgi:acyl carrier protein